MLDGYPLPLQWPADPAPLAEMDRDVLQWAGLMAGGSPEIARRLYEASGGGVAAFVREVTAHWPPGPGRPWEIARLAKLYGEDGGSPAWRADV